MPWLQLIAESTREQADAIENTLLGLGALSVTLQEHIPPGQDEQPILEPNLGETPLWDHAQIVALFDGENTDTQSIDQQLQLDATLSKYRWEQLEDKNWEREWMDNYHPIQCADSLWICPSWQTPPDPQATNILLDPGLAFGTGTHPTTFLCMQWLAYQNLSGKNIIDYGCGSGILGITALRLGAKTAEGVDIDPQALIASQDNTERNGLLASQFPVYLPSEFDTDKIADIVLANILAGPLVELADDLLKHLTPGGMICLSGVLASQADKVIAAYKSRIKFEPISQKEEWVRLSGHCYQ